MTQTKQKQKKVEVENDSNQAQEPDEVVIQDSNETPKQKENEMQTEDYLGIASIIIGVLNLCTWIIIFCGCPFSIIGIIIGILGMKSKKYKTISIVGLVLSGISLFLTFAALITRSFFMTKNMASFNY